MLLLSSIMFIYGYIINNKMQSKKSVSIKKIAELAGCCPATVSNVLNNARYSSKEIRKKVLDICKQLNYKPNLSARNLRTGRTYTIGLMFNKVSANIFENSFYLELLDALQHRLSELNYDLLLTEFRTCDAQNELPRALCQRKVDGLILLGGMPLKFIKVLKKSGENLLLLDSVNENIDSITSDGFSASSQIVEHLHSLGHKIIAYFAYDYEDANTQLRISGFTASAKKLGIKTSVYKFENAIVASQNLHKILNGTNSPTAIMCVNDNMAFALISEAKKMRIDVPKDLSVVGFDGISLTKTSSPTISTAVVDIRKIALMGADSIIERINTPNAPIKKVMLPVEFSCGQSSGKVAK